MRPHVWKEEDEWLVRMPTYAPKKAKNLLTTALMARDLIQPGQKIELVYEYKEQGGGFIFSYRPNGNKEIKVGDYIMVTRLGADPTSPFQSWHPFEVGDILRVTSVEGEVLGQARFYAHGDRHRGFLYRHEFERSRLRA